MIVEPPELKQLYAEAQAALEARDSDRARALLKQIVAADENFRDASRLLAGLVERERRLWYRDVRLWMPVGAVAVIALLALLATRVVGGSNPSPAASSQSAGIRQTQASAGVLAGTEDSGSAGVDPGTHFTWKRIDTGQAFLRDTLRAIAIHPKDPEVLLVGAVNAGIYESIDGGLSWHPAFSILGQGGITSLEIDSEDPDLMYAGVSSGGLFRTQDRGVTWERIRDGTAPNLVVMDAEDSRHLFFVSGPDVFESSDGGDSWQQALSGEPSNYRFSDMIVVPEDGTTLYAYGDLYRADGSDRGVYRSTDGGRTWNPESGIGGDILARNAEGVLVLGGGGQVYRREPGGVWQPALQISIDAVELAVSAANPRRLYALRDGVWFSEDGGATWSDRSNGLGTAHLDLVIHPLDSSLYFGETGDLYGDCALYRSLDRGVTWTRLLGSEKAGCRLALDAGGEILYRTLGRSEDGGLTWAPMELPGQGRYIAAHPVLPGTVYAVLWDNPLAVSTDFGTTWEIVGTMRNDVEARLFFGEGNRLYAFGYPQGQRSSDLGRSWTDCAPFVRGVLPSRAASRALIDPRDSEKVLVATRGAGIQLSEDGCLSWRSRNDGIGSLLANTLARDPNHPDILYAGTDGGAYVSFDAGEHWGEISDGLLGATVVYSIVVDPQSNVYAATPYGIFRLETN